MSSIFRSDEDELKSRLDNVTETLENLSLKQEALTELLKSVIEKLDKLANKFIFIHNYLSFFKQDKLIYFFLVKFHIFTF